MTLPITFRPAAPEDARVLSVLAMQVFLDTYATDGIDAALAAEVSTVYTSEVFRGRLADPAVELHLAVQGAHAVGFVDIDHTSACPLAGIHGAEVFRLYVQRPFQGRGVGRALMALAGQSVRRRGGNAVWLTAWVGNARALAFYAALGWRDVGATTYMIDGTGYENRVLTKPLTGPGA